MGDRLTAGTYTPAVTKLGDRIGRFGAVLGLSAALMAWSVDAARAVPFTSDLVVNASGTFVEADSYVTGNAEQSGSFFLRQGGIETTTSYSGGAVSAGSNPLVGNLTDLNDGVGINAGFGFSAPGLGEGVGGIDMVLDLQNTSATDSYEIEFVVNVEHTVDSGGTDAFAHSEFTLGDTGGEFFFSDIASDTAFGDERNGTALGTFGDPVSDPAGGGLLAFLFTIVLAPGDVEVFDLAYTLEGGGFDTDTFGIGDFTGVLAIKSVTNLTQPQPVPEPATLALFGVGLLGLGALSRRGRRRRG